MTKTKILLTGGTGMVGRNVIEKMRLCDIDLMAPRSNELNLLDEKNVKNYISELKPDIVIHSAGRVGGIQANIKEPVKFLVQNMDMGKNLILAARETGVKKLMNLGSSCMYPRNHDEPLTEDLILSGELEPTNEGYALAKIMTTKLCEYIKRENSEYNYKTLIPCNIYGKYDNFDSASSHLIPAIIQKIHFAKINNESKVVVWGDGKARREFMYAGELADVIVNAMHNFNKVPDIMNVGIGYDYTINQYYEAVAEMIGWEGEFSHDLTRPVGMQRKLTDVNKLKTWGWSSKVSLIEGLQETYLYYKSVIQ